MVKAFLIALVMLGPIQNSNAQSAPVPGWKPYWTCNNPYNSGWAPAEIVDRGVAEGRICTTPEVVTKPQVIEYYEMGKYYQNPYGQINRVIGQVFITELNKEYFVLEEMICNGGVVGRLNYHPVNEPRKIDTEVSPVGYDLRCSPLQNTLAWNYFYGRQ